MPGTEELPGHEHTLGAKAAVLGKWGQVGSPHEYPDRSSDKEQMAREVPRLLTSTAVLLPALCEGTVLWLWGGHGLGFPSRVPVRPWPCADRVGLTGCWWACHPPSPLRGHSLCSFSTKGIRERSPSALEIWVLAVANFLKMRVGKMGWPARRLRAFKEIAPIGALINVCFMMFQGMIA